MNRAWMLIPAMLLPILCHAAEQSCSRPAVGEPASARIEQIEKMEHERVQAGVRKDVEAIAAVTADDYVQIDWNGEVLSKSATLARIRSGEIKLQSNTLDEVAVRLYGDTAVVTGLATRKGTMNGKDVSGSIRYSRVYVNRDGRWQVVAFQQTPVGGRK